MQFTSDFAEFSIRFLADFNGFNFAQDTYLIEKVEKKIHNKFSPHEELLNQN